MRSTRSFVKIKPSRNGYITLSFTDVGKACLSREFLTPQICLNTIRENKILAKISEFTVLSNPTSSNETLMESAVLTRLYMETFTQH